jgi:hypothetical protein
MPPHSLHWPDLPRNVILSPALMLTLPPLTSDRSMPKTTPKLKVIAEETTTIAKPNKFDPNKYRSKRGAATTVETLPVALPVLKLADANDFVRLHPEALRWIRDVLPKRYDWCFT